MKYFNNLLSYRPRTEATWTDVKKTFHRHPIKATLVLPIAFLALGFQYIGYFLTLPFAALNDLFSFI